MAYVYALDVALPANTDLVSQGAQNIRELKAAVRERINSFFVNVDTDPLAGKDGAVLGNTTVKALTPVADDTYALGTSLLRFSDLRVNTATFSGAVVLSSTLAAGATTVTRNTSGAFALTVDNDHANGYGLKVVAGSALADYAFVVDNYDASAQLFSVRGNGWAMAPLGMCSATGTTVCPNGVTTALFASKGNGMHIVLFNYSDNSNYGWGQAIDTFGGGLVIQSATDVALVASGSDIAINNASGAEKTVKWSYIFIPLPAA